MPFVFDFDHAHRKPPMEMKDLLGGKGANLAEMTSVLELPVPPGFTIATTACRDLHGVGLAGGARPKRSARPAPASSDGWASGSATPPTRCWCRCVRGPSSRCPG